MNLHAIKIITCWATKTNIGKLFQSNLQFLIVSQIVSVNNKKFKVQPMGTLVRQSATTEAFAGLSQHPIHLCKSLPASDSTHKS